MKKLFSAFLILSGLAIAALLIVPGLVDWNRFKPRITETLQELSGLTVRSDGDVHFSMLPSPTLSVSRLTIAALPGANEPELLRLSRLEAKVALIPLLSGRIEIERIVLSRPELVLETLPDGRRLWPQTAPGISETGAPPSALRLDRLVIEDGSVLWRNDAAGPPTRLTGIWARVGAASLAGPFDIRGEAALRNVPFSFEISTGGITEGSTTPVRWSLALPDGSARMRFAGLAAAGTEPRLQGDLRAEMPRPDDALVLLARAAGKPVPKGLPSALRQALGLHGALDARAEAVSLAGLELKAGEASATGNARLVTGPIPALELKLAAARLELEPWLDGAGGNGGSDGPPPGLTGKLELSVDVLGFHQGVLRQAKLSARLDEGTLTIDKLSAAGPGGSDISLSGTVGAGPEIDAAFQANTDNLRVLLDWARVDSSGIAADRLRRLSLSGRLHGRADDFRVSGLDLRLDTTRLSGQFDWHGRVHPKTAIKLAVDHLDFDAYRIGTGGGQAPVRAALADALTRADVELELHLGHLVAGGQPVRGLELSLSADNGALTLRTAKVAEWAGIAGSLTGTLATLSPLTGADLSFTAETGSLTTAERVFGLTLPPPLRRLGALKLGGHVTGTDKRLNMSLNAEGAGGRLETSGAIAPDLPGLDGPLALHAVFAETGRVVRLFAPNYQTIAGSDPGPTDLSATLTHENGRLRLTELEGTLAGVALRGQASGSLADASVENARPFVELQLQTGEIMLDRLLPAGRNPTPGTTAAPPRSPSLWPGAPVPARHRWSSEPLGLDGLSDFEGRLALDSAGVSLGANRLGAPVLRAGLEAGVLRLEQLDGEFKGGRFGATGRLAANAASTEAALTATLVGARLEHGPAAAFDLAGGIVNADLDVKSAGNSELALVEALNGNGHFTMDGGTLYGIDLSAIQQHIAALRRSRDAFGLLMPTEGTGNTAFEHVEASAVIEHGLVTLNDGRLTAAAGTGEAKGTVNLPARTLNLALRFAINHQPPLPGIGLTVSGSLDQPHKALDTRELQSYLARELTGSVLRHLPPGAPGAIPGGDFLRGLFQNIPTGR
ncbi:MAG: AsmA family protein [Rhodospirillaceae bacterium]